MISVFAHASPGDERDEKRVGARRDDGADASTSVSSPCPRPYTPHGSPSRYQTARKIVHNTMRTSTYGSIKATTVPTPASFWYFCANVTTSAKYALSGVMALIGESPTLYAASTASGVTLSRIRRGTKTGANRAHFGMAPVMIRSSTNTTITNPIRSHSAFRFMACSVSASDRAAMIDMFV